MVLKKKCLIVCPTFTASTVLVGVLTGRAMRRARRHRVRQPRARQERRRHAEERQEWRPRRPRRQLCRRCRVQLQRRRQPALQHHAAAAAQPSACARYLAYRQPTTLLLQTRILDCHGTQAVFCFLFSKLSAFSTVFCFRSQFFLRTETFEHVSMHTSQCAVAGTVAQLRPGTDGEAAGRSVGPPGPHPLTN